MLFRPQALQGQQQAWLGSIELLRPLSHRLLSAVAIAAVLGVCAFLTLAETTRKARISGSLVPDRGVLRIHNSSTQPATVLQREVAEGQSVRAGEVLFVLSLDNTSPGNEGIARNLSASQDSLQSTAEQERQLAHTQQQALQQRRQGLERELQLLKAEAALQAERLALASETLARQEQLSRDQFISPAQLQSKREDLLALKAQSQALERQRESLQRDLQATLSEARQLPLRAEVLQGEIARDRAELGRLGLETENRRRLVLRAPTDGIVSTLLAEPGQSVASGASLASLLPAGTEMQAQLYAPSSAVGFLRPQQAVHLRYQAFPYQKFGLQYGRVLQVSRTPLLPAELATLHLPAALSQSQHSEPLYRVTVGLDAQSVQAYGEAQPLAAGMQLEADVLLERRRLIEWIFEPLLSLAHRV